MYGLLNNKVDINFVELDGIVASVDRNSEGKFNFDYIINAFKSPKKKDNSPPMEFSIDKVELNNVRVKYADAVSKNDLKMKLTHLDTRIKTFDLNQMNFEVPNFKIDGLQLSYKQGIAQNTTSSNTEKSKTPDLKLQLGTINLSKIKVDYQDEKSKLMTNIDLKKLLVKINSFDLNTNSLDVEKSN